VTQKYEERKEKMFKRSILDQMLFLIY